MNLHDPFVPNNNGSPLHGTSSAFTNNNNNNTFLNTHLFNPNMLPPYMARPWSEMVSYVTFIVMMTHTNTSSLQQNNHSNIQNFANILPSYASNNDFVSLPPMPSFMGSHDTSNGHKSEKSPFLRYMNDSNSNNL